MSKKIDKKMVEIDGMAIEMFRSSPNHWIAFRQWIAACETHGGPDTDIVFISLVEDCNGVRFSPIDSLGNPLDVKWAKWVKWPMVTLKEVKEGIEAVMLGRVWIYEERDVMR